MKQSLFLLLGEVADESKIGFTDKLWKHFCFCFCFVFLFEQNSFEKTISRVQGDCVASLERLQCPLEISDAQSAELGQLVETNAIARYGVEPGQDAINGRSLGIIIVIVIIVVVATIVRIGIVESYWHPLASHVNRTIVFL